ncbi:MAG: outer membrane beta-barrel protein [Bacteroidota bacterium]
MKKKILFFAFLLCVSFSLKAQFKLGPSIGLQLPLFRFSSYATAGFSFGGTAKYMLNDKMAVGGNIFYSSFSENRWESYYGIYKYSVIPITGMFQYYFADNDIRFYCGGDFGLYILQREWRYYGNPLYGSNPYSDSSTELGMAATFGMEYKINDKIILDGNTKLHFMLTEDDFIYIGLLNFGILFNLSK